MWDEVWGRKCYYLTIGLLRIFKIKDLFFEKRNHFQENPIFLLYMELKKIFFFLEELRFPPSRHTGA